MLLLPLVAASIAALFITVISFRSGALTASGATAAFVVGTVALSAGWRWGLFLVLWFVSASLLSRAGRERKARRSSDIIEKPGARDARQVLANGAVFALSALAFQLWPHVAWPVIAAASLAAAGADTWATEIGTWVRADAWSVRELRRVPAGTSGAVTSAGTAAMVLGAAAYASLALMLQLVPSHAWITVTLAATGGATADTIIGAWAQERRWCRVCDGPTEQARHTCGARTEVVGGFRGLDNDAVNTLATLIGAALALMLVGPGAAA